MSCPGSWQEPHVCPYTCSPRAACEGRYDAGGSAAALDRMTFAFGSTRNAVGVPVLAPGPRRAPSGSRAVVKPALAHALISATVMIVQRFMRMHILFGETQDQFMVRLHWRECSSRTRFMNRRLAQIDAD